MQTEGQASTGVLHHLVEVGTNLLYGHPVDLAHLLRGERPGP